MSHLPGGALALGRARSELMILPRKERFLHCLASDVTILWSESSLHTAGAWLSCCLLELGAELEALDLSASERRSTAARTSPGVRVITTVWSWARGRWQHSGESSNCQRAFHRKALALPEAACFLAFSRAMVKAMPEAFTMLRSWHCHA